MCGAIRFIIAHVAGSAVFLRQHSMGRSRYLSVSAIHATLLHLFSNTLVSQKINNNGKCPNVAYFGIGRTAEYWQCGLYRKTSQRGLYRETDW